MATIKNFTDISQSKTLSKILPLESADMVYVYTVDLEGDEHYDIDFRNNQPLFEDDVCAWSLAALLSIFPPYLFEFERGIDFNVYPNLNGKGWHCSYMPNCIENMKKDKFRLVTSGGNLVDACVAMIEKLHDLNLL